VIAAASAAAPAAAGADGILVRLPGGERHLTPEEVGAAADRPAGTYRPDEAERRAGADECDRVQTLRVDPSKQVVGRGSRVGSVYRLADGRLVYVQGP
jgi:hypothetical protein